MFSRGAYILHVFDDQTQLTICTATTTEAELARRKAEAAERAADEAAPESEPGEGRSSRRSRGPRSRAGSAKSKELNLPTKVLLGELGEGGQGRADVVLGLLDEGADANYLSDERQRPLYMAAAGGFADIIPLLLDAGAEVNARNVRGETALHAAVRANLNNQECIEKLLDSGAETKIKSSDGETPYSLALSLKKRKVATFFGTKIGASSIGPMSRSGLSLF